MPHEFGTRRLKIVQHLPVCLYHLPQASAWTWYLEAPWTPTSPTLLAFKLQPLLSSGVKLTILIWLRFVRLPCNQTLCLSTSKAHNHSLGPTTHYSSNSPIIARGMSMKLWHTWQHLQDWSSLGQQEVMESSLLQQSFHEFCSTVSESP